MAPSPTGIRPPSRAEIRRHAADFHIDLTEAELEAYAAVIERRLAAYDRLDSLDEPTRTPPTIDRDPGYRPDPDEDPLNAYVRKCRVEGAGEGPLSGVTVGVKDNIAVAGIEMTCGSRVMAGYVPSADATVVTRLLEAGSSITAKCNLEDMAVSSVGDVTATGPVLNPHDPSHLAGGSSSGSAVAVVTGEVDVALGTDQAGSIRIPAAVCGCVGLKPTFGLVPYTGIVGAGYSYDHVGPMAMTTELVARALDAIAGPDPDDPRQDAFEAGPFVEGLGAQPGEVSIGVLEEGLEGVADGVSAAFEDAIEALRAAGATVERRSVPGHDHGVAIRNAIASEAMAAIVRAEGVGHYVDGWYDTQFARAFAARRRAFANEFPPNMKLKLVLGGYLAEEHAGSYHAKAHNLSRDLATAYDGALAGVDVLALPTTRRPAYERIDGLSIEETVGRGHIHNTAAFDVTGHPAVSVPCGTVDDLPVGIMFVGERFDDATVLEVADAFERAIGWDGSPLDRPGRRDPG